MRKTSSTPTVGYWTKLAHGKKARRRELPVSDKLPEDREISIYHRAIVEVSGDAARASAEFKARLSALKSILVVPEKLSRKLPSAIAEIKRALLDARVSQDGFVKLCDRYKIEVSISKSSINRVVRILVAVEQAGKMEGNRILFEKGVIYWEAEGERFPRRINKIKQHRSCAFLCSAKDDSPGSAQKILQSNVSAIALFHGYDIRHSYTSMLISISNCFAGRGWATQGQSR